MPSSSSSSQQVVGFSPSCKINFPMIEWHLIAPSHYFWKINVDLTFVDDSLTKLNKVVLAESKRRNNNDDESPLSSSSSSTDKIERLILVTFQNSKSELAPLAKKRIEKEKQEQQQEIETTAKEKLEDNDDDDQQQHQQEKQQTELESKSMIKNNKGEGAYMYSEAVTEWKDECRDNVLALGELIRERLEQLAPSKKQQQQDKDDNKDDDEEASPLWWFDVADPATGVPVESTAGPSIYCESDSVEQLLKMPVVAIGIGNSVCRMVQHPKHGTDVYPCSMFYAGPRSLLDEVLKDL